LTKDVGKRDKDLKRGSKLDPLKERTTRTKLQSI